MLITDQKYRFYAIITLISLPHNKVLVLSISKVLAEDKSLRFQFMEFESERIENIVEKEENAGKQHFLLFAQHFQEPSLSGSFTLGAV